VAVLTAVGTNPPFVSRVQYGTGSELPGWLEGKAQGDALPSLYTCSLANIDRTVRVSTASKGCEAIYRRADGQQDIVWHSDHHPTICASKAAEFVRKMEVKGMSCSPH